MVFRKKRSRPRRRSWRRYFRRGRDRRIPLLPVLGGVAYPMMDSFQRAGGIGALQSDPINFGKGFLDQVGQHYIGFSMFPDVSGVNGFNFAEPVKTYTALIAGVLGSKLASATGVNRYMKKIPIVGSRIKL